MIIQDLPDHCLHFILVLLFVHLAIPSEMEIVNISDFRSNLLKYLKKPAPDAR